MSTNEGRAALQVLAKGGKPLRAVCYRSVYPLIIGWKTTMCRARLHQQSDWLHQLVHTPHQALLSLQKRWLALRPCAARLHIRGHSMQGAHETPVWTSKLSNFSVKHHWNIICAHNPTCQFPWP